VILRLLLAICAIALPSCREAESPRDVDGVPSPAAAAVPGPMAPDVAAALEAAGPNRPQLERAILDSHGDEQKAAAWLVARTPFRGTVGNLEAHLAKVSDSETLSTDLLRADVTQAFEAWHRWPWAREVDSDTFLQFVLPYRMTTEELEDWRAFLLGFPDLVAGVERLAEAYRAAPEQGRSAVFRQLVHFLNSEWLASHMKYAPRGMPDLAPSKAIAAGTGRCTDLTNALIALCRTFGVPATGVRTLWWPKADSNHYWAAIYDPAAKTWYDVDAASTAPLDDAYFHIQHGGCHAKVYKIAPGEERGAVARAVEPREGEAIPPLLDWYLRCTPMVDVTSEYTKVSTTSWSGLVPGRLYGLAVFNNGGLQEVAAARATPTGEVAFSDVGAQDVLYFITTFEWKGNTLAQHVAGPPFVLRLDGKAIRLRFLPARDAQVTIDCLPATAEVSLRRLGDTAWEEVLHAKTDAEGRLTVAHAPRETVMVVFDSNDRPIGRPMVLFEKLERF